MGKLDRLLFVWLLNSFFLRLRRFFLPLLCVLPLFFCTDCRLSTYDLRYSHPNTPIIQICDRPLDVSEDVELWGYNYSSKRLVTDENGGELRAFYAADVFFEYVESAPRSSLEHAPPDWGLKCPIPVTILAHESTFFPGELLPLRERCPATGAHAVGRVDPSLFAEPTRAQAPCDSPKKKAPVRVHVCVHPPGVGDVSEWGIVDVKGIRMTRSEKEFQEEVTKAKIIFVFDKNAPPESVYWFVQDPKKLSCPDKPAPRPYDQVIGSGMLEVLNAATSMAATLKATDPKKGDGKTTETSSPDGKGPPLNFLESLVHNADILAALASGNTSGKLNDPNGARHGSLSGTNVGGSDLLAVQAAAATFAIIGIPFKSSKDFLTRIINAVKKGKTPGILDPTVLTKELAEKLAEEPKEAAVEAAKKALAEGKEVALESFGKAMAIALRDAGVIMPYSRAEIFTRGWGGKFQAHHALEVAMAKKTLKMDAKAIDDIPAIILTEAEHTAVTDELNATRGKLLRDLGKTEEQLTPADLWQIYKEAYKKYPAWLDAIKGYFPNVP